VWGRRRQNWAHKYYFVAHGSETVVRKTPQVARRISSAIEVESDTGIVQDPDIACIAFAKQPRVVDWIVDIHREMPPESADEGTG
jgi:hypothetical protein